MERNGGAAEVELTGSDLVVMDESRRSEITGSVTCEEIGLELVEETADITVRTVPAGASAEEELSEAELIPLDEYRAKRARREVLRPLPPDEELTRPAAQKPSLRSAPLPRPSAPPPPPQRASAPPPPPSQAFVPAPAPRPLPPPPSMPPARSYAPPTESLPRLPLPSVPPLTLPPIPRLPAAPSFPPPPSLPPPSRRSTPMPMPMPASRAPAPIPVSSPAAPIERAPAPAPMRAALPTPIPYTPERPIRIPIPERREPARPAAVTSVTTALDSAFHFAGRRAPRELWTYVLGIAILAGVALATALVIDAMRSAESPRGALGSAVVVTVAGPSGTAIPNAIVFADGRPWCDSAPCRLEGLEAGVHLVHVTAPGFVRAAQRAVSIGGSEDRTLHFELVPEASAATLSTTVGIDELPSESPRETKTSAEPARKAAPATPAAPLPGVLNLGSIPRSSVVVDGRPLGMTPQRVRVSAGPHSVLFVHPDFGRVARSVQVVPGGNHTVSVKIGQ